MVEYAQYHLGTSRCRREGASTPSGYEHRTPITAEAVAALEEARRRNSGIGNAPVLPAPQDPSVCLSGNRAYVWWNRAEKLAGLEPKPRRGWHSLRRKFASDLMNQPYVDAPKWASPGSEPSRWQPGQVLSYVRPLDAALVGRGPVWCSCDRIQIVQAGSMALGWSLVFPTPSSRPFALTPFLASCLPTSPGSFSAAFRLSPFCGRAQTGFGRCGADAARPPPPGRLHVGDDGRHRPSLNPAPASA